MSSHVYLSHQGLAGEEEPAETLRRSLKAQRQRRKKKVNTNGLDP